MLSSTTGTWCRAASSSTRLRASSESVVPVGVGEPRREKGQPPPLLVEQGFECLQVPAFFRHRHAQAAHAAAVEGLDGARVDRVFQQHVVARAEEHLAHQVERLLAAVGDEQLAVARLDALAGELLAEGAPESQARGWGGKQATAAGG